MADSSEYKTIPHKDWSLHRKRNFIYWFHTFAKSKQRKGNKWLRTCNMCIYWVCFLLKAFIQSNQSLSLHHSYCLCFTVLTISIVLLMFTAQTVTFTGNIPNSSLILPSTALDIHHFLNSLTVTTGEICCHHLDPQAQQFCTKLLYCPSWCQNFASCQEHSEYTYFEWYWGSHSL
jgi:hypothetical protein